MKGFQILLCIMIVGICGYTGIVGLNHGWDLLPIFFGDIAAMTWPGQFNFDFGCFLILSGLWVAWRSNFSPGGLALSVAAFFGGMMFLSPYLLIAIYRADGDVKEVLLGKSRKSG